MSDEHDIWPEGLWTIEDDGDGITTSRAHRPCVCWACLRPLGRRASKVVARNRADDVGAMSQILRDTYNESPDQLFRLLWLVTVSAAVVHLQRCGHLPQAFNAVRRDTGESVDPPESVIKAGQFAIAAGQGELGDAWEHFCWAMSVQDEDDDERGIVFIATIINGATAELWQEYQRRRSTALN